jgi:DNA-binding response OmpR family regulator
MTSTATRRVCVLGCDRATLELLSEWLSGSDIQVDEGAAASCARAALVIVDVPYPRQGLGAVLDDLAAQAGSAPVLAVSATFHESVELRGEAARSLGVAGVLPKPLQREALLAAVKALVLPAARVS